MIPIDHLLAGSENYRKRYGRPLVTLSYAQSLDGSIAARRGETLPMSGEDSLIMTHRLRSAHDALLVGIGTVLADNPRLNVRFVEGKNPQPVVLDSHLRCPVNSNLLKDETRSPWIFATPSANRSKQDILESVGARVTLLPSEENGWVNLEAMLEALAVEGISTLMVEGGARVITSFLQKQLVDRLVVTITPKILGGLHAVEHPLFPGKKGMLDLAQLPQIRNLRCKQTGSDIVIWASLNQEV